MANAKQKIKIMVGSTVYGFEDQLSQIVAQLQLLHYEVMNSHNGSIKVNPKLSNIDNCLNAVKECDLFLGIIRPYYGTGNIDDKNIVFEEIKMAIKLKKPYWFLVHRDVVFARLLFNNMEVKKGCKITVKSNKFFDKRTIDIYDYVIQNHQPIILRNGNWAQEFYRLDEMMSYITTQFEDREFVKKIMNKKPTSNGK